MRLTLERYTDNTDTDPDSIARALDNIRECGWAIGDGERIPEAYGIAAPFFADGRIAGSITVTIPKLRVDYLHTGDIAAAVRRSAEQITRTLSLVIPKSVDVPDRRSDSSTTAPPSSIG
ncbi:IclR family transcriptional regulator domain-containing protein [Rhodococcus erythropolis]|uniref:IclR family transcriptional regulator domain-containing protein n=1 Tax=Rhodococcus erythropolis TaxID=1833 RepID=UPI000877FB6F|nr:IclR family transcriptional regulator C-terminal domain-containing protein [Rhodococcus erythropolis]OFV78616.1 bacterial transcriptional regulator [Rhodococcus erythropolis]